MQPNLNFGIADELSLLIFEDYDDDQLSSKIAFRGLGVKQGRIDRLGSCLGCDYEENDCVSLAFTVSVGIDVILISLGDDSKMHLSY